MKRFLSVLLTIALLLSMVTISAMAEGAEPITITVYDAAANYHGIQKGWFAKVVLDKFNIVVQRRETRRGDDNEEGATNGS